MKFPKFTIQNTTFEYIDKKYNFTFYQKDLTNKINEAIYQSKTKVTNITKDKKSNFSYIDEAKKEHICVLTMKNLKDQILNNKTDIHCFWCRHEFENQPLGCPIDYVNDKMYKKYYSEITKNNYVLQETITKMQYLESQEMNKENDNFILDYSPHNYYLVDGIFCSFNCCLSFINANNTNPIYIKSKMFLKKIYIDLFPNDKYNLEPAPDWRLLKNYGGELSITEFRKSFYKIDYKCYNEYFKPFNNWNPINMIFEKKIKL